MIRIILLRSLFVLFCLPAYPATLTPECNFSNNVCHLDGVLENNVTVKVVIKTVSFDESNFPYVKPLWWGAEFNPPMVYYKENQSDC